MYQSNKQYVIQFTLPAINNIYKCKIVKYKLETFTKYGFKIEEKLKFFLLYNPSVKVSKVLSQAIGFFPLKRVQTRKFRLCTTSEYMYYTRIDYVTNIDLVSQIKIIFY